MTCPDCGKQFATVEQRADHVKNVDCCSFYPPRGPQDIIARCGDCDHEPHPDTETGFGCAERGCPVCAVA